MLTKELTIINKLGLHARATAKLVTLVNQYKSDVTIKRDKKSADAKSMMSVMMLAAAKDCRITITAQGNDEKECMKALAKLINNRFDESE